MKKMLLIGAGNMTKALWSKQWSEQFAVTVYTPSYDTAVKFTKQFGGQPAKRSEITGKFDVLFLGCKPQQITEVAEMFKETVSPVTGIISILASIDTARLQQLFLANSVLRLMPNTPAKVGKGTITYFSSGQSDWSTVLSLLALSSVLVQMQTERDIDITTPISGSGPAFIFELARIWQLFLQQEGIDATIARELVVRTFVGSSHLLQTSGDSFEQLRNEVTSKGGVTQRGLESLSTRDFEQTVLQSLKSALARIDELRG